MRTLDLGEGRSVVVSLRKHRVRQLTKYEYDFESSLHCCSDTPDFERFKRVEECSNDRLPRKMPPALAPLPQALS